jgi:hypothetical protein
MVKKGCSPFVKRDEKNASKVDYFNAITSIPFAQSKQLKAHF